tara:strand:+ start:1349 stop:1759 length:411 start_codon:yes stop_codon:yes gene_type:complete
MAQSNQLEVKEKIYVDLKVSCFNVAYAISTALIRKSLSHDALTVYVEAMFNLMWAEGSMSLRFGLYHNRPELLEVKKSDIAFGKIEKSINSLDNLEAKYKDSIIESGLDDLKANFISMQEYEGAWEVLYTTEEPPF